MKPEPLLLNNLIDWHSLAGALQIDFSPELSVLNFATHATSNSPGFPDTFERVGSGSSFIRQAIAITFGGTHSTTLNQDVEEFEYF